MKKIISITLSLLFVIILAGCSGEKGVFDGTYVYDSGWIASEKLYCDIGLGDTGWDYPCEWIINKGSGELKIKNNTVYITEKNKIKYDTNYTSAYYEGKKQKPYFENGLEGGWYFQSPHPIDQNTVYFSDGIYSATLIIPDIKTSDGKTIKVSITQIITLEEDTLTLWYFNTDGEITQYHTFIRK